MSPASRGMAVSLIIHYWRTECAPLPTQPARLFVAAHGDPAGWHRHKDTILRLFSEIKQDLDFYMQSRKLRKSIMQGVQAKGVAVSRAKRLEKNAPSLVDYEDRAPVKAREQRERVATPDERGPRRGFLPTRR
jgi:hypothetical protein